MRTLGHRRPGSSIGSGRKGRYFSNGILLGLTGGLGIGVPFGVVADWEKQNLPARRRRRRRRVPKVARRQVRRRAVRLKRVRYMMVRSVSPPPAVKLAQPAGTRGVVAPSSAMGET